MASADEGSDPEKDGAITFAFGLDRCVQVRDGLDDSRIIPQTFSVQHGSLQ